MHLHPHIACRKNSFAATHPSRLAVLLQVALACRHQPGQHQPQRSLKLTLRQRLQGGCQRLTRSGRQRLAAQRSLRDIRGQMLGYPYNISTLLMHSSRQRLAAQRSLQGEGHNRTERQHGDCLHTHSPSCAAAGRGSQHSAACVAQSVCGNSSQLAMSCCGM
jgi:hypothetical protein